jgi:hypothetical protein
MLHSPIPITYIGLGTHAHAKMRISSAHFPRAHARYGKQAGSTTDTGVSRAHLDLYRIYVIVQIFKIAALATAVILLYLVSMDLP